MNTMLHNFEWRINLNFVYDKYYKLFFNCGFLKFFSFDKYLSIIMFDIIILYINIYIYFKINNNKPVIVELGAFKVLNSGIVIIHFYGYLLLLFYSITLNLKTLIYLLHLSYWFNNKKIKYQHFSTKNKYFISYYYCTIML